MRRRRPASTRKSVPGFSSRRLIDYVGLLRVDFSCEDSGLCRLRADVNDHEGRYRVVNSVAPNVNDREGRYRVVNPVAYVSDRFGAMAVGLLASLDLGV